MTLMPRTHRTSGVDVAILASVALTAVGGGSTSQRQKIFRFDTFGVEQVWTETLRLHEVVEKSVDPTTARGAHGTQGVPHDPTARPLATPALLSRRRSAATLADVLPHYNRVRTPSLTEEQQRELIEYLKSLWFSRQVWRYKIPTAPANDGGDAQSTQFQGG
jgi:hypothetical protein